MGWLYHSICMQKMASIKRGLFFLLTSWLGMRTSLVPESVLNSTIMHQSIPPAPSPPPPPPPALPPPAEPRALAFFLAWMANSWRWGLSSCQIPRGGDKKRGQMPHPLSALTHFSLITQSNNNHFKHFNVQFFSGHRWNWLMHKVGYTCTLPVMSIIWISSKCKSQSTCHWN